MEKIAIVVQRYGKDVNGGAETHARLLAKHLKDIYEVDVLTTCALDHHSWENHYLAGTELIDDINVIRFHNKNNKQTNKKHRRLARYLNGYYKYAKLKFTFRNFIVLGVRRVIYRKKKNHSQLENVWMSRQGPVSPDLIFYIEQNQEVYKAFIFFTYLFYPSFYGIKKVAHKSIFIPTAHDEPTFHYNIFKLLFSIPRFIMYNSASERSLVEKIYPCVRKLKYDVCGVGFVLPKFNKTINEYSSENDYFVYIGRVDRAKGCDELIRFFSKMNRTNVHLILIGKNTLNLSVKNKNIIFTGFIGEDEKMSYLRNARALIIPSRYESLSMVTLEAMAMGRPVLANGHCDVLKHHIDESHAGFVYYDFNDFVVQIDKILHLSDNDNETIHRNGRLYVERNFSWSTIVGKFINAIEYVSKPVD